MKHIFVLIVMILLSGCKKEKDPLIGKWEMKGCDYTRLCYFKIKAGGEKGKELYITFDRSSGFGLEGKLIPIGNNRYGIGSADSTVKMELRDNVFYTQDGTAYYKHVAEPIEY